MKLLNHEREQSTMTHMISNNRRKTGGMLRVVEGRKVRELDDGFV
jgi:hypothetical protein